jgi:hypothetical protein
MGQRLELQAILVSMVDSAEQVYFQPPPSLQMKYPCIVYNRTDIDIRHADNKPYKHKKRYQVTVIDRNPDSVITDKVATLPMCSYDRSYTADNLNHDVFTLSF